MSWGGAHAKSQVEAYHKPFTAETGIIVNSVDSDNPASPIKAQVEAGNMVVDVADIEFSDAVHPCDEGLLEETDTPMLLAVPDGISAADGVPVGEVYGPMESRCAATKTAGRWQSCDVARL